MLSIKEPIMRAVASQTADIVRPFLWVASLSFATGFLGYLALT